MLAVLADGALIASVISVLPARVLCTTAELSMTFLGPPPAVGGELIACGRALHVDAAMALAEAHVRDTQDRLVAHGTSRCSVFPPIDESTELLPPDVSPARAVGIPDTPDPYLRPAPAMVRRGLHDLRGGVELLRAELRGELSPRRSTSSPGSGSPPSEEGRVAFTLPAGPWLRNEWGTVYGGALTLLAKSAAAAAVQSTAARGTGFTALDVKINFLRAEPADGRDLVATGTVFHRGKRLAVATAEAMHGDHRVAVTGTTALSPLASLRSTGRRYASAMATRAAAAG